MLATPEPALSLVEPEPATATEICFIVSELLNFVDPPAFTVEFLI